MRDIKEKKITAKWAKTKSKQVRCEIKENIFSTEQRIKNKEIAKRKRYEKKELRMKIKIKMKQP